MIQGLREEKEEEKLLKEKRRVLKEEEKEKRRVLKEEEKEKEKLLKEKEKEEERLLKEKRRVLKEEEKEKEKLLREKEKEEEKLLKEKEKEEERLLRQQEREEFHQKVTNLEIRFQSEIGGVQAALEHNIGEVRTECKRLEIELARIKSLEGAVISPTGRNIPPPTFDGQTSLEGFRRQFEAVTLNNGWGETEKVTNLIVALRGPALDLLQAVPRADQQSYAMLMGELELRYGEQHLRQVYQAQLKLRRQKVGESLQGFEADVKRLCHLAYPGAPIDFLDQLAAQTFVDGIRDVEVQRVLRLASFDKSREALVRALEVEAAYRVSESGYPRVRGEELIVEQSTTGGGGKSDAFKEILKRLERLEETGRPGRRSAGPCFRCGRHGHLKRQCTRVKREEGVRLFACEDKHINGNSEGVVRAVAEEPLGCCIGLAEPTDNSAKNLLVARTLVNTIHGKVPVRVANVFSSGVRIRKGDLLATCTPISRISTKEDGQHKIIRQTKLELDLKDLSEEEARNARAFLKKNQDAFSSGDGNLGRTDLVRHRINTGDARPIRQPPRRLPMAKQEEVTGLLRKMKRDGIIEEFNGPWSSPVVLVTKKDGTTRFCVDYRRLNDITKKDSYPLPRIDDTLTTLAGSSWFSTLDLKSGYWQVGMHPEDKEKTAFSTGSGLYQFTVMPFGLCNAPATFERLIELVLKEARASFHWNEECEKAFRALKRSLCSSPILAYPQPGTNFILDTDASNLGIGAVLSQVQDEDERVIEFFSRVLTKAERNYCATRKELLAIVKAVEHFHKYLYGQNFLIRTDHAALTWLLRMKNPEGQVARWLEKLQQYHFQIKHRPGRKHNNADALSRRPCGDCEHCERIDEHEVTSRRTTMVPSNDWTAESCRTIQQRDPNIGPILEWKERGNERPSWEVISDKSPELKTLWSQWDSLSIDNGLLKRIWESADGRSKTMQLVVPKVQVPNVLREIHDGVSGAHFGINKTLKKVRERFYWVYYHEDVERWCKECDRCAASKEPKTRSRGVMREYNMGAPFERIAIDVAGPFPVTEGGNKYILVAMDYFTKWPEAYAIPNQEATTVAKVLMDNLICRFGVPLELHSDQGRNFEAGVFQELCRLLGIRKTRTTPLHPQSDGMVERFNKTMEEHLSKVVEQHQRDWDVRLPPFLMAYRAAIHETTRQTPAKIMFGRELRLPCDLEFGSPGEPPAEVTDYVNNLRSILLETHELVRAKIRTASHRMKTRYDQRANHDGFRQNDLVWLFDPKRKKGLSPKLMPVWEGPYKIIKRINDLVY
ncbi:K02A2.6-like, partial [Cordylochernes scorpioides]